MRIEQRGGLMDPDDYYSMFPTFTLLGDGRVILPGGLAGTFIGGALPPAQVRQLTEAGTEAVLSAVADSGQFVVDAHWAGASSYVFDAGSTYFTLNADGRTVSVSFYGIGFGTSDAELPSLPTGELAAYRALNELAQQLTTLDAWLPANAWAPDSTWQPYVPEAIRLFARIADHDLPPEGGTTYREWPWPTADEPAWIEFNPGSYFHEFRCAVVSGDDASAWYEALSGAKEMSRFVTSEHHYEVTVRLMLPDELAECPAQ